MITQLDIENFRSIKSASIKFNKINAVIGPNNAGKSNILRAIDLLLGDKYVTEGSFQDSDFYKHNKENTIRMRIRFDEPLQSNWNVYGFSLDFDGNECIYSPINMAGEVIDYGYGPSRVKNEMKDEVRLMLLGVNRLASQQIKTSQWELYGRLLKKIERTIDNVKKEQFEKDIERSYNANIYPQVQEFEELLKQHTKELTGLNLDLHLSILDPLWTIKGLRPYLKELEDEVENDVEGVGAGVQSMLAVSIANAYSKIVKKSVILAIEEPELYLHPHGCRVFYSILKKLADNVQVIYTTHDSYFVNIENYKDIILTRKYRGQTTLTLGSEMNLDAKYETKMLSKFDEERNEIFFADTVILVEGYGDKIACSMALEKLGIDLDRNNISIIEGTGAGDIPTLASVLVGFQIEAIALIDDDKPREIEELKAIVKDTDAVMIQGPGALEGMWHLDNKPKRDNAIGIFTKWLNEHEQSEIPDIYKKLSMKLTKGKSTTT